jgi:heme ABC exporter ATP-binding subunit CcmA
MSAPLAAVDLSRRFGRQWAVRRVSATFEAGSVTALVGDNGAGKSTLLSLLAGLLRPDEGHVQVMGAGAAGFLPVELRRQIAHLGHLPFVYTDLTGRENVAFFERLYGCKAPRDLLERVGLADAADRPARGYSRGMVQRLALARIVLQDAPIWLLDEPTTGLDVHGLALLRDLLASARRAGRTLVAITHDLEALGPIDQMIRLIRGRSERGPT